MPGAVFVRCLPLNSLSMGGRGYLIETPGVNERRPPQTLNTGEASSA
uniref:Uncharacterized protein n=1 Tax=Thermosporothrix sp. COM3 TaxID=2490863 RepID=A0A455SG38_9CHLR|nr:hypothetical protein KTC_12110 [Thermosporothrix sp. COM3]